MLSSDARSTFLAALSIALLVLIAALAAYSGQESGISDLSTSQENDYRYNQGSSESNAPSNQHGPLKEFWDFTTRDAVSFYTFILAIFTGILGFVSIIQGFFLYKADRLGRESLTSVQRAFVFIRSFENNVVNNNFIIMPIWENSGTTPAEDQTMWASWRAFGSIPDTDFYLLDFEGGKWIKSGTGKKDIGFIGPHSIKYAPRMVVPIAYVEGARLGNCRLFVWGWTEYKDVFSKARIHRTEFCNEIVFESISTDPVSGNTTVLASFAIYGPYNTAQ